jgi:hypothetical protein
MKKTSLMVGLFFACLSVVSQNRENEKISLKYVQLPLKPLVGVQTYNCQLDASLLMAQRPDFSYDWGLTADYVKGLFSLQGLSYMNENADITLTLKATDISIASYKIANVASGSAAPSYKMIFKVKADWRVMLSGKVQDELVLNANDGEMEVRFPADTDKYGLPSASVATADILEKSYAANGKDIDNIVIEWAASSVLSRAGEMVQSNYAFKPVVKQFEISSFKTNKKFDAAQWEKITPIAIGALKGLTSGQSAEATYEKGKEAVDFWAAQFEQLKGDVKTNDKLLEAATKNLITFLSLCNPSLVKDEYVTVLNSISSFEAEELMKWATPMAKRFEANKQPVDYAALGKKPALHRLNYETLITLKSGEKVPGVILFSTPYYNNPYELSGGFKMYKTDAYISANCVGNSKIEVDAKTVASYELLGKTFESIKYSDPTALSLSGNEEFVERICDGAAPLFKKYTLVVEGSQSLVAGAGASNYSAKDLYNARKNPVFLLQKNKKTTVVMNYTKLADQLADCPAVADKIKSGAYGNKPVNAGSSKIGSILDKGTVSDIDEQIITKVFVDYNNTMKN